MRHYEDLELGDVFEHGDYHVTTAEIVEFAEKYSPQPVHADEEAAKESAFGELIASGWHTAAICTRLRSEIQKDDAIITGLGVDELRWRNPVFPGDTLHLRMEIAEKYPSESRPDSGHIEKRVEGLNQDDETVITLVIHQLYERRKPASADR